MKSKLLIAELVVLGWILGWFSADIFLPYSATLPPVIVFKSVSTPDFASRHIPTTARMVITPENKTINYTSEVIKNEMVFMPEIEMPPLPQAGYQTWYKDSKTHKLTCVKSNGSDCSNEVYLY